MLRRFTRKKPSKKPSIPSCVVPPDILSASIADILGDEFSMPGMEPDSQTFLEEQGIYYITGPIFDGNLNHLHQDILIKHLNPSWNKEIHLIVNSPGGDSSDGWALIDLLDYVRMDIRTTGMGECASLGAMLIASGTPGKRCATQNCTLMVHEIQLYMGETIMNRTQFSEMEKVLVKEHQRILNFWLKRSNLKTQQQVQKQLLGPLDHYLMPDEALKIGIIDSILGAPVLQTIQALKDETKDKKCPITLSKMTLSPSPLKKKNTKKK